MVEFTLTHEFAYVLWYLHLLILSTFSHITWFVFHFLLRIEKGVRRTISTGIFILKEYKVQLPFPRLWNLYDTSTLYTKYPDILAKASVRYFSQIFIFHQMITLPKLWKMFFISPKKLFSFSRYSNFCISIFPSFSPWEPLL